MYIPFDEMPGHSRIWIYQAQRELTGEEEKVIADAAQRFCEQWVAHGDPLQTSYRIEEHRFLILGVDEEKNLPSGCSIDTSVHMLKYLKDQLGVDFLDRSQAAFWDNGKVMMIPLTQLKQAVRDGILAQGTLTFHVLAPTKDVWNKERLLPAGKTWLSRFLAQTPAT